METRDVWKTTGLNVGYMPVEFASSFFVVMAALAKPIHRSFLEGISDPLISLVS